MDVLILAYNDWANTGFKYMKCLQHLGLDVMMFKGALHAFWYPEQAIVHPALAVAEGNGAAFHCPALQHWAEEATVLQFVSSVFIDTKVNPRKKKVVFQHGGTFYRHHHKDINGSISDFVDASIIQCPDLLGLGAVNEHLIYYPVDTNFIKAKTFSMQGNKLRIGHFPSSAEVKGTDKIEEAIKELAKDPSYRSRFIYSTSGHSKKVRWMENLQRMQTCDVIIEGLALEQNGARFGEWGNQALEAAAMGKIVVTHSLSTDLYKEEYGPCELRIANSVEEMVSWLKTILDWSEKQLETERKATRAWVEAMHSIPATAQRMWSLIYRDIFDATNP